MFEQYFAHHQELATILLIITLVVSFLVYCRLEVRCSWAGIVSGLQVLAELLTMDIQLPETC